MEAALARGIVELAEQDGTEMKVYEEYSGRGMYGRTTTGVTCESFGEFACALARYVNDKTEYAKEDDEFDIEQVCDDLRRLREDSMGRSSIILY